MYFRIWAGLPYSTRIGSAFDFPFGWSGVAIYGVSSIAFGGMKTIVLLVLCFRLCPPPHSSVFLPLHHADPFGIDFLAIDITVFAYKPSSLLLFGGIAVILFRSVSFFTPCRSRFWILAFEREKRLCEIPRESLDGH